MAPNLYKIHPLLDPRCASFLERHPDASIFYTPDWLEALRRTYGYEPVVFTTSGSGEELKNGIALCRVDNWLMGCRMVSLPFSDQCEPLVNDSQERRELLTCLAQKVKQEKLKYIELRPRGENKDYPLGFGKDCEYWQHTLDLRPKLNELFSSFHKDSIQRKIRRAEREGLAYEEGRSRLLLGNLYRLMLITRRRHELPPPPFAWFQNLVDCLGEKLKIRVASKEGRAVAALLALSFKNTVVYKYGCSDARFHNLGGMLFLFWKTIEDAKKEGAQELDLGRTDKDNAGLRAFKEQLGTTRSGLTYLRFPPSRCHTTSANWKMQMAKLFFLLCPTVFLLQPGG